MGKGIPLARKEKAGQSVLLASSGSRGNVKASAHRDKRQKDTTTSKRRKTSQIKDTTKESKDLTVAKGRDGKGIRRKKYRYNNPLRKYARATKGADIPTGRSAKEMGIEWVDSYCAEKPSSPHAHYSIEIVEVNRGSIFQCVYCRKVKWFPNDFSEAVKMGNLMEKVGKNEGYCMTLDNHPTAKKLVAKLQEIRLLRNVVSGNDYLKVVAAIIVDRSYSYKEVEDGT